MIAVSRTHQGKVRKSNQDATLVQPGACGLFGIADGMGGHRAGEIASGMAVDSLARALLGARASAGMLEAGIQEANALIFEAQRDNAAFAGMGTTMTVLWDGGDHVLIGHVGDSRAYLFRDGALTQQTDDHSMVAELVRRGALTPEKAAAHPYRSVITRAVGTCAQVQVDVFSHDKQRGDRWLLCSDGLSGAVSDGAIARVLRENPLEQAADVLVNMALAAGGQDNISLVLLEVDE